MATTSRRCPQLKPSLPAVVRQRMSERLTRSRRRDAKVPTCSLLPEVAVAVALALALAEAGPNPDMAIEADYGWVLGRRRSEVPAGVSHRRL